MSSLSVASMTSATSSDTKSPTPSPALESMHRPELAAKVEVPQSVDPMAQGVSAMNGKALLAKKLAATGQNFYSPTDTMVSPCTAKLHLTKQMRFTKMSKPQKPALLTSNSFPSAVGTDHTNAGYLHTPQAPSAWVPSTTEADENQAPIVQGAEISF